MHIQRITQQGYQPLATFYRNLHNDPQPYRARHAPRMQELIECLERSNDTKSVWAYTDDTMLTLTDQDGYTPGVQILTNGDGFTITYPLAEPEAPWSGACVEGYAYTIQEAINMITIAWARLFETNPTR